jgi:signal peptidase I
MLIFGTGFTSGYIYKHHWLGVHLYFVPSMSMYPTLKPPLWQDSWHYLIINQLGGSGVDSASLF